MKSGRVVRDIMQLEKELFADECYLDESQQAKLASLYNMLGRALSEAEKTEILRLRSEYMLEMTGEYDDELLNRSFSYMENSLG